MVSLYSKNDDGQIKKETTEVILEIKVTSLKEHWNQFLEMVVDKQSSTIQVMDMKMCFFAGAQCALHEAVIVAVALEEQEAVGHLSDMCKESISACNNIVIERMAKKDE